MAFNFFVHCLKFTRDAWKLIEKIQMCTRSTTLLIECKGTAGVIHRTANEVSRNSSHQELFQIWEYAFPTEAGLSMSSLFRPNYANLFMGKFELVHVYNNNNNPYFCMYVYVLIQIFRWLGFIFTRTLEDFSGFKVYPDARLPRLTFTPEATSFFLSFFLFWIRTITLKGITF